MWPQLKHQTHSFHLGGIICPLLVDHDPGTTVVADFHDLLTLRNFYIKELFFFYIDFLQHRGKCHNLLYIFLLLHDS